MTTLERISDFLHDMDVDVVDCRMRLNTSIAFEDGYIGLDTHKLETSCAVASCLGHEAGHFICGAFYHADNPYDVRERAELSASKAMWFLLMPPRSMQTAIDSGLTEAWELSEWFGLPESDVVAAFDYYVGNGYLAAQCC